MPQRTGGRAFHRKISSSQLFLSLELAINFQVVKVKVKAPHYCAIQILVAITSNHALFVKKRDL